MKTIKEYITNNVITAVTHNGVCHADDIFVAALLSLVATEYEVSLNLVRTRDEKEIPENAIIFDVFNGELDHHNNDGPVDGRKLAAFGLAWRAFKNEIKGIFSIDEESWVNIDQSLVKFVDHTDNTGEANPLSYVINSYVSAYDNNNMDKAFEALLTMCEQMLKNVLEKERKMTDDRRILNSLPVMEVNGKKFAIKREIGYLSTGVSHPTLNGVIIHMGDNIPDGDWMVKCFCGTLLTKKGIRNEGDVIFTHQTGFMGKGKTLEAVLSVI